MVAPDPSRSCSPSTVWVRSAEYDSAAFRRCRLDFRLANRLLFCARARGCTRCLSTGRRFESLAREFHRRGGRLGLRTPVWRVVRVATLAATSLADRGKFDSDSPRKATARRLVSLLAASRYNLWVSRSVVQIHSPRFEKQVSGVRCQNLTSATESADTRHLKPDTCLKRQ